MLATINRDFYIPAVGSEVYLVDATSLGAGTADVRLENYLSQFYTVIGPNTRAIKSAIKPYGNITEGGISFKAKKTAQAITPLNTGKTIVGYTDHYGELDFSLYDWSASKVADIFSENPVSITPTDASFGRIITPITGYALAKKYICLVRMSPSELSNQGDYLKAHSLIFPNVSFVADECDFTANGKNVVELKVKLHLEIQENAIDKSGNPVFGYYEAYDGGI
jgi:hypothetical protein